MLGRILKSRYELFYYLGSGGFGQTYLARDLEISERAWLVVKQLKTSCTPFYKTDLEKAQQLFIREIEVLQDLGKHDRIPSLFDYFTEAGESYLVQEFVDGCVFSEELKQNPDFSEAQILVFLQDSLEVLDFVHSRQVIHRDIKPSNLIRRRQDKRLVLIDFGAVKQISAPILSSTTGTRISTDVYTSREQERGKPRPCSDIYSLGVVAIQAFTSSMPSIDEDTNEIDWQNQRSTTKDFAAILNKMVRERPIDRYASASEVLHEVESLMKQLDSEIVEQVVRNPTPYKFDYVDYWYREANKLRDLYGYHRLAIYLYDKVIEIDPRCLRAHFNKGITLTYLRRYEDAIQSFNSVIDLNSKFSGAYFQKGFTLFLSGFDNSLEALNSYNLAIKYRVFYPIAWFYKGITLKRLGRYEEAIEAYEVAQSLRPSLAKMSFLHENEQE